MRKWLLGLFWVLSILGCGNQASISDSVAEAPGSALSSSPSQSIKPRIPIDPDLYDPEGVVAAKNYDLFMSGKLPIEDATVTLLGASSFDYATHIWANQYRKERVSGTLTPEKIQRYADLAVKVTSSIYVINTHDRNQWTMKGLIKSGMGATIIGGTTFAITKAVNAGPVMRYVLERQIVPVILSTSLIGGLLSGAVALITAGTFNYWAFFGGRNQAYYPPYSPGALLDPIRDEIHHKHVP